MKNLGHIAYDAYCQATGGKSLVTGDFLPAWSQLKPDIQEAWVRAAEAVRAAIEGAVLA